MKNINILCIVQARVSSSRLPGKVLLPIIGKPMIIRQLERVTKSKLIDKIVVATTIDESDDELVDVLSEGGIEYYRGDLDDVLSRFYKIADLYKAEHIVRVTGDCPLIDFEVIDMVIIQHLEQSNDYTSNVLEPTFPDGLDVEVMKFSSLEKAYKKADLPSEREHVTLYVNKNPEYFKVGYYNNLIDYSHMRWTVDEREDYDFVVNIYEKLFDKKNSFKMDDVIQLLNKEPLLQEINSKFKRNEGLINSIKKDKDFN